MMTEETKSKLARDVDYNKKGDAGRK